MDTVVNTSLTTPLSDWQFKALVLSIVAATAGYLGFSLWGGWADVVHAFAMIGTLGTLIALALSLVNYGLRFLRWQIYLARLGHPVAWLPSLRIYLSGFALTTTPGKAGETFRSVLLKQRDVPYPVTLAAFISERLSDLVAIILLTLVGLFHYPQAQGVVLAGVILVVALLLCLSSRPLLSLIQNWANDHSNNNSSNNTYNKKISQLIAQCSNMLSQARQCHTPGLLALATIISLVAWGAEALAFFWVLSWLEADITVDIAVFIYALAMLAGALSFLPGGLGGAEAVMVSLLVLKGMTMPAAIAATVFIRLATLWFAVAIGLVALWQSRHGNAL